ncbi:MAG: hypothetical protein WC734_02395 [Patescibacteria group bacterium]|jgi:hypothetical protein
MEQDIPAWYELGVKGTNLFVTMSIETAAEVDHALTRRVEDTQSKSRLLGIRPFENYRHMLVFCHWGFGGCATAQSDSSGIVRMTFAIPPVITGVLTGDWSAVHAVAATLEYLFWALQVCPLTSTAGPPQLFVVSTSIEMRDCYGAPITVKASRAVSDWMRRNQPSRLPLVEQAMEKVYRTMVPTFPTHNECRFVSTPPRWFHLECPGDACGIDPYNLDYPDLDQGYELCPHNTDSAIHQLTLLAGLAALHQVIRNTP